MDKQNRIDRYVTGKLSPEEKAAFEKVLEQDQTLQEEVRITRQLVEGLGAIQKDRLKKQLMAFDQEGENEEKTGDLRTVSGLRFFVRRYWKVAAVLVGVFLLAHLTGIFTSFKPNGNELVEQFMIDSVLLEQSANPIMGAKETKGDSSWISELKRQTNFTDYYRLEITATWRSDEYDLSKTIKDDLLQSKWDSITQTVLWAKIVDYQSLYPNRAKGLFYQAIFYFRLNNIEASRMLFQSIYENSEALRWNASFYLALIDCKKDQFKDAKSKLLEIRQGNSPDQLKNKAKKLLKKL